MAGGVTGIQEINQALLTFMDKAEAFYDDKGIAIKRVTRKQIPRGQGRNYNQPVLSYATAAQGIDGVLFDSPTPITDGLLTISTNEQLVQVLWTNKMAFTITEDFVAHVASALTDALAYKLDVDICTQFDSASTVLGGASASFTGGFISAARQTMRVGVVGGGFSHTGAAAARATGNRAPLPISAVVHPYTVHDLAMTIGGLAGSGAATDYAAAQVKGTYAGVIGNEVQRRYVEEAYLGDIRGVPIYDDANILWSANLAKNWIGSARSIIVAELQGMQEHKQVEPDGRAVRHTMWNDYGIGEVNDSWQCEIDTDATPPTS